MMKLSRAASWMFMIFIMPWVSSVFAGDQPNLSGFLDDPPVLKPVAEMKGAWGWDSAEQSLKNYNKILLDPVEIWIAPYSEYKGIDADKIKMLADSMRAVLVDELEPAYPVVSKGGPGVLRIRIALTDVYLKKKKRSLFSYTPIGLVASGVKSLAGKPKNISLVETSVEMEAIDMETNERIAVRLDQRPLRTDGSDAEKMSWEAIQESFRFYGKRVRERLDKAHAN
jgi:hypothetical protein